MTIESLLVYGAVALGGYLLRHFGVGGAFVAPSPAAVNPAAPLGGAAAGGHPLLAGLEGLAESIAAKVIARIEGGGAPLKK